MSNLILATDSSLCNVTESSSNVLQPEEKEVDAMSEVNVDETADSLQNIEISTVPPQTGDVEMQDNETAIDEIQIPSVEYVFQNTKEIATFKGPPVNKKHFSGCKWSPDGTCILTSCADYTLRIFDLPKEIHNTKEWDTSKDEIEILPSVVATEGGLIYDFAWYPFMSSWDPITCCFISTSSGAPLHLWDAYTGKIRGSYRPYDYADEIHSALSVTFSTSGELIYSGFRDCVKIFDISRPGRDCRILNLKGISGQKGLISCISENPAMPDIFAVGTYSKTIGLYTDCNEFICLLAGQKSGLTQIKFSNDGTKLYSGARMDNEIICWDIRNLGNVLYTFNRVVNTNQRIYFDLTADNKYLFSGGTDGIVSIWDQTHEHEKMEQLYEFKAHDDCANGVSLHTSYPILATVSGQYHYPNLIENEDDNNFFSGDIIIENSLKLWWMGHIEEKRESMETDS